MPSGRPTITAADQRAEAPAPACVAAFAPETVGAIGVFLAGSTDCSSSPETSSRRDRRRRDRPARRSASTATAAASPAHRPASSAKAKISSQKPAPGEMRAKVLPGGRQEACRRRPIEQRQRRERSDADGEAQNGGVLQEERRAPRQRRSPAATAPGQPGSASRIERALPATMRLARKVTKGMSARMRQQRDDRRRAGRRASLSNADAHRPAPRQSIRRAASAVRRRLPAYFRKPFFFRKSSATALAGSPPTWMRPLSVCSVDEVELGEDRRQQRPRSAGYCLQHRLADDRRRLVDRLHALVVVEHDEAGRRNAAVGAVDHGGVDAVGLVRPPPRWSPPCRRRTA